MNINIGDEVVLILVGDVIHNTFVAERFFNGTTVDDVLFIDSGGSGLAFDNEGKSDESLNPKGCICEIVNIKNVTHPAVVEYNRANAMQKMTDDIINFVEPCDSFNELQSLHEQVEKHMFQLVHMRENVPDDERKIYGLHEVFEDGTLSKISGLYCEMTETDANTTCWEINEYYKERNIPRHWVVLK